VSRCIARALDEEVRAGRVARTDRILLLEEPGRATSAPFVGDQLLSRGSQPRFVWQAWRTFLRRRHELVLFDLVGLARSVLLPLPGFPPPRFAIFVHGIELGAATKGSRARALGRASRILANSRFTAEMVRGEFPELEDRLRVVPLCIDPERVAAWEALGPATIPRQPAALIVGRLWSEEQGKGHDELLAAWPSVRRAVPGAELWIAGGGDDAPRLEARAHALGVAGHVRMLGRVSDATLADLYRRASVYAMPSRQEGFGIAYAEAMWFGLPCLGSNADAAGQVIVDGETGVLVPYGNVEEIARRLIELLSRPEQARRMGEAARRHARKSFGYQRFRSDLLAALDLD
jgi:phosphatidylinositol alpha-1,6-mannosyltransferase